ncbi:conserved hypothetical protein [Trichinella spiralis]|uniref:hypothetical protein n=1 Tax=Trichinella spiralis TaxID=6334 RepID=UPI0001EFE801|nr:conserved hypothetical protein [Trichinella spiralis]
MRQWYDSCTRGRVGCEKSALEYVVCSTGCSIAVFRRVELGSVDEPSRSARKDDRARDSAFDLPLGTTVVARVFVHFERAVATYRVSGAREPEDVREGDRHRRDPLTYWPDERTSGLFIPERQITVASLTLTLVLRAGFEPATYG